MLNLIKLVMEKLLSTKEEDSAKQLGVVVFDFTDEEFKNLKIHRDMSSDNDTNYLLGSNKMGNYLKADSKNAASGLGKKINVDLNRTPFINFNWKIEKGLEGLNEQEKEGHDFAARLFVVKKTGFTIFSNRVINYVYSSNRNIGETWSSPFTKRSINVVVSTTTEIKNEWVTVKRNVKDDFKKIHNLDVDSLDGIAIMVDTNDSGREAVSYYQNIYFSA